MYSIFEAIRPRLLRAKHRLSFTVFACLKNITHFNSSRLLRVAFVVSPSVGAMQIAIVVDSKRWWVWQMSCGGGHLLKLSHFCGNSRLFPWPQPSATSSSSHLFLLFRSCFIFSRGGLVERPSVGGGTVLASRRWRSTTHNVHRRLPEMKKDQRPVDSVLFNWDSFRCCDDVCETMEGKTSNRCGGRCRVGRSSFAMKMPDVLESLSVRRDYAANE